ncbi:unnamed protein product, partial [Iphiclides podalirius]
MGLISVGARERKAGRGGEGAAGRQVVASTRGRELSSDTFSGAKCCAITRPAPPHRPSDIIITSSAEVTDH